MGGGACGAIFLDLSKAFDTVNHEVLLLKLRNLGFRHSAVSWFCSYLSGRKQSTRLNGVISSQLQVNSGVPQGSILGPLLFICYINDLPNCLNNGTAYIYADDTAIVCRGNDIDEINASLSIEFSNVCRWFEADKLSVNNAKTNTMLFCGSRSKHKGGVVKLTSADGMDVQLDQVNHTKYLGVELDEHLTYSSHIDKLCSKIRSRNGMLKHMRNFISEDLAKDLYRSMIHPHFAYADVIYDACNLTLSNKLQTHQNQSLRTVLNVEQRFPSKKLHEQTGVNWLSAERKERCCIEAYRAVNNMLSQNVNSLFPKAEKQRELRCNDSTQFTVLPARTKFGDGNLPNWCKKYRRVLPDEVRNADKMYSFKNKLRNGNFFKPD